MNVSDIRKLPRADLHLSVLGLGCAQMGNLYRLTSYDDCRDAFDTAWDRGIRYFDTAPYYGHGRSELRLGSLLGDRSRRDFVLSTKVGRVLEPDPQIGQEENGFAAPLPFRPRYDYTHDGILRSFETSQIRTGVIDPDILYIHDIGTDRHGAKHDHYWSQLTEGGGFRALTRLRTEGSVKAIGLGVNEWEVIRDTMAVIDVDIAMLAGRYTLLEQDSLAFLDSCAKQGTAIVAAGVFNSGILAGNTKFNYLEAPADLMAKVATLRACCEDLGVDLQAAALQFPMAHPAVVSVVVGCRNGHQMKANADWFEQVIPDAFWVEVRDRGLLSAEAPLPGQAR